MFRSGHDSNKGQLSPYHEGREYIKGIVNDDYNKGQRIEICEKLPITTNSKL